MKGDPGSAIYSVLKAGTALITALGGTHIYREQVPQTNGEYPCVVIQRMSGLDTNTSPRRDKRYIYMVKVIVQNDLDKAEEIDDEIEDILHDGTLTIPDWGAYWCKRRYTVQYREAAEGGNVFYHVGAQYEIRIAE